MHTPFFITGLPQSRTTWLANLFTTSGVFCHHDLIGTMPSVQHLIATLTVDALGGRVGDADSGLLVAYPQIKAAFQEAPWVLVRRNFDEAWDSLTAFVGSGPWREDVQITEALRERMLAEWEKAWRLIIQDARCLEVYYESLDKVDTLERIWKHCVPGVRFDARRAELLQTFQVRPFQEKSPLRVTAGLVESLMLTA